MLTGIVYCGHCRTDWVAVKSPTKPPNAAMVNLTEPVTHLHPITREVLVKLEDHELDLVDQWHEEKPGVPLYEWLGMTREEYARWVLGEDYHEQGRMPFSSRMYRMHEEMDREKDRQRQNRWYRRAVRRIRKGLL